MNAYILIYYINSCKRYPDNMIYLIQVHTHDRADSVAYNMEMIIIY